MRVGCLSIAELLWKTASVRKISLKLGNQLQSYGQNMIFNIVAVRHLKMVAVCHLKFSKFRVYATEIGQSATELCIAILTRLLEEFPLEYFHNIWCGKLEWCYYPMVKIF